MIERQKLSLWTKQCMSGLMTTLFSPLFAAALLVFMGAFVACGDGNDDPADCNADQYYNDSTGRCTVCGAVEEPQCREGCGFTIERDERSCPVAVCSATCDMCAEGEVFSEETFGCVAGN